MTMEKIIYTKEQEKKYFDLIMLASAFINFSLKEKIIQNKTLPANFVGYLETTNSCNIKCKNNHNQG